MSHTCFRRTSRGSKLAPWYYTVIHTFGYVVLGLHFIILNQFRWQTCFTPPSKWGFGLHYKVIYNNIIHLASFFSFASFLSSFRRYLTPTTDVVCWIHPVFFDQTSLLVSTELRKQTVSKSAQSLFTFSTHDVELFIFKYTVLFINHSIVYILSGWEVLSSRHGRNKIELFSVWCRSLEWPRFHALVITRLQSHDFKPTIRYLLIT